MPGPEKAVQQESSKVIAVAATQDVMSEGLIWAYAFFATSLAWALMYFYT